MLALSTSALFRIFFKMLFGTVLLGVLSGLVFFPALVILTARAGDNTPPAAALEEEEEAAAVEEAAAADQDAADSELRHSSVPFSP